MKKNLFAMALAALMLSLGFASCGDDEDDVITPSDETDSSAVKPNDTTKVNPSDTTKINPIDTTANQPIPEPEVTKFTVTFLINGETLATVSADSATALKDIELPKDNADRKIIGIVLGDDATTAQPLTQELIDATVIDKNLTIMSTTIALVKQPTLDQLKASNYTAAGKYFDFKNMKAYSLDWNDENKYTYVSDITFDAETSTISFGDEFSDYNYALYFVGNELYRQTGIYNAEDANSFYGKYIGKDRYGDDVTIELTEDKFIDATGEHSWKLEGYVIKVADFYDYYYNGKSILTLRNYFTATENAAPTVDGTSK